MRSQYKPDFSIYFERNGKTRRIYLEHFGVDARGLVPAWFAKDRGISYEEANRQYTDGIAWKKAAHEKFGTTLLTTSSADFHYSDITEKLKSLLDEAGVPIREKTNTELYNMVLPKGSKQEKAFIRLVATFITLVKSSCKSAKEALQQASRENDKRSVFIINNIFLPVYGFPSLVSDDPVLNYVLTESDQFPHGEERRLFYVAVTRTKIKTVVLYDRRFPSVFVDEFLRPEQPVTEISTPKHPNSGKIWTHGADKFLLTLHREGKSVKYIAHKMGRSQTSIVMRLEKLKS